jgi:alpha-L-rhamnosidase
MHLSTGFVGTPYLNPVLTRFGRSDVAYALLHQKTFPSWLFPITHGATTMWERWDGWTPERGFNDAGMNSYNHYAFGAIGEWLYTSVAGIDLDALRPGYKHIVIRPQPRNSGLTHARATLRSMHGVIESAWRLDNDGRFELSVLIPPNTTATVHVPAADAGSVRESGGAISNVRSAGAGVVVVEVGAGAYRFESRV